jgi:hypothetical protein
VGAEAKKAKGQKEAKKEFLLPFVLLPFLLLLYFFIKAIS